MSTTTLKSRLLALLSRKFLVSIIALSFLFIGLQTGVITYDQFEMPFLAIVATYGVANVAQKISA